MSEDEKPIDEEKKPVDEEEKPVAEAEKKDVKPEKEEPVKESSAPAEAKKKTVKTDAGQNTAKAAFAFIVLMAVMSLFNDMTFEGANSSLGAFESYLGAPTVAITAIGGIGTLLGCALRMVSGYFTDKTKKYWAFTIVGYCIDVFSVPLLALVPDGGWQWAIAFILLEKVGKAIKKPAKSSLISFASHQTGEGKSFAFTEALDQIGAVIGPLILTLVYTVGSDLSQYQKYTIGFAVLGIPAVICITLLLIARHKFPAPDAFETKKKEQLGSFWTSKAYILFVIGAALFAAGYMDSFSLINAHLSSLSLMAEDQLPLLYSYAMLIDAVSAIVFGFLFDKIGFYSIAIASLLTAPYAVCFFVDGTGLALVFLGLTAWGIGMGAMESVLLAGVSKLSKKEERARAYGFFELFYGVSSFGFSFLTAYLYDTSRTALNITSLCFILVATVCFFLCQPLYKKQMKAVEE